MMTRRGEIMSGPARVDTIVRGGKVVTASDVTDVAIAIKGERIVALGPESALPPADHVIDATGKIVFPGAIDCHVHLGPEYDTWVTGPVAAAHAGLTTLVVFGVYDDAKGETLPHAIEAIQRDAGANSVVDFGLHFILNKTPYVLDGIADAVDLGVTSFKLFMTYKWRGTRMCSDDFIIEAMEKIARAGGLCQLHCENGDVIDYLERRAIAEGRVTPADFPPTCPDWAEEEAINRAIAMGRLTGCPVYVVHLSTTLGLERIKQAQATGQRVWTETCPQYMLLTANEMERWGPLAKIGPPLRRADGPDRDALWKGSEQGYIANVASDHSPRVKAAKAAGWKNIFVDEEGRRIPFGSPSVETLVPLVYSEGVVGRGLPLTWMARVIAENPARTFGLYPRKGTIRVGSDADLLIWDPDYEGRIHVADHRGIAGWTLYEDWRRHGRPWMTLLRGRTLLKDGKLEQEPGFGTYLRRSGPLPPLAGAVR
jgi:dihydropyrimidinase